MVTLHVHVNRQLVSLKIAGRTAVDHRERLLPTPPPGSPSQGLPGDTERQGDPVEARPLRPNELPERAEALLKSDQRRPPNSSFQRTRWQLANTDGFPNM